jgi:hypothetical protein
MAPIPRRNERPLPQSSLVRSRLFFDLSVCGRVFHIGKRPTLLNHPAVQVLAFEVTCGKRSLIGVNAARGAIDFSAPDMRSELVAGVYAASPADSVRIEANLVSLGRVDSLKSDLRSPDCQRVAINDPWHT